MNNLNRVLSIVLILVLLVGAALPLSHATAFNRPIIGTVGSEEISEVKVGAKTEYKVKFKNESSLFAKNVEVKIDGNHPFAQATSDLTRYIGTMNPGEVKELSFTVSPSPLAQSKVYSFTANITYLDGAENTYQNTANLYVKVVNPYTEPQLAVSKSSVSKGVIKSGQTDVLTVHVKNFGDLEASNIKVKITGFGDNSIILNNDTDTKTLNNLKKGEDNFVYFNIVGGPYSESGTKKVDALITYTDQAGNSYEKTSEIRFEVEGGTDEFKIININAPSSVVMGDNFNVSYTIQNNSNKTLDKGVLSLQYSEAFLSKSGSIVTINDLKPGESRTVTVEMMAKEDTQPETYHNTVKFTTSYGKEISEYVSIYVKKRGEGTDGAKPKLIIDKYSYGEVAMAGEEFELKLDIKNTSTSEGTKNIKVTVSSEDNVFTPVDSSSSFFVKNIGPEEVQSHSLRLKTKVEGAVKIYTVTIKMEYEDSKGNAYDANKQPYVEQENLSIAVGQPVRLETGELIVPPATTVGSEFYVEQEFYNMGKSTMYNLMIEITGVSVKNSKFFVGNFDSGRSDYYSVTAWVEEEGVANGKVIYTFEDALGKKTSIEKDFTIEATAGYVEGGGIGGEQLPDLPPDYEGVPQSGVNIYLIAGGALLLIVVVVLVLKRRKAKKSKLLEESDDE